MAAHKLRLQGRIAPQPNGLVVALFVDIILIRMQWIGDVDVEYRWDNVAAVIVRNVTEGSSISQALEALWIDADFGGVALSSEEASFVDLHALTLSRPPLLVAGRDGYSELPLIESCLSFDMHHSQFHFCRRFLIEWIAHCAGSSLHVPGPGSHPVSTAIWGV